MSILRTLCASAAALLLLASGAIAKDGKGGKGDGGDKPGKQAKPLFAATDVIRIAIAAPFGTLAAAKPDASLAGTLRVSGAKPERLAVALAPRGVKRRDKEVCPFPPLWVSFAKKPPKGSLFQGQKKLKLVTHCRPIANFQSYVALEYAAYRLYGAITPASFNARLATIDYVNEKGQPITTRLGFFIEDADDMAKRNGLHDANAPARVPSAQLAPRDAASYALFQMMIGNLDWAMNQGPAGQTCCHNSKLIGEKGEAGAVAGPLVPVPYDFDYAGLVDAPYAAPPPGTPVSSVRVRRYRGFCRHNAEVPAAVQSLLGQRAGVLAVLRDIPQLSDRARGQATDYIADFFDQMASQPDFAAKIVKTCV